jgi:small conductance mechanosensitive channel
MAEVTPNKLKINKVPKRPLIITLAGTILMIVVMSVTLEISHRQIFTFITSQERYVISAEGVLLVAFIVEMLVRLATLYSHAQMLVDYGSRIRLLVRIIGYCSGLLVVVSVLASNATLGISVGAIAGALVIFSSQNILSNILAAVLVLSTRMFRIGEDITVGQTSGKVSDITLTHTLISSQDDVVFVPNSVMISNAIRRKKRALDKNSDVKKW